MKVFISYKWEDSEHNAWVEKLATDLKSFGIETYLDKLSVRYGDSLTDYMTSMIGKADVVLFIMTTKSVQAADSTERYGGGVKFELQVTISRIVNGDNVRLIPVYREGKKVATYLRDRRYADFRDDSKYGSSLSDLVNDILKKEKVPSTGLTDESDKTTVYDSRVIPQELHDPFGYLAAESIHSPKLLRDLCSIELGYFRQVTNLNHQRIVITGPRGCGKTMILKYMRFITQFEQKEQDPEQIIEQIPYVGLFLSMKMNFSAYLLVSSTPTWSLDTNTILFYFNILVSLEVLEVLDTLLINKLESLPNAKPLITFFSEAFHLPESRYESLRPQLISLARNLLANNMLFKQNIDQFNSSPIFMNDLVSAFQNSIQSFNGKPFILLVDDLSFPKIQRNIIDAICRILFHPGNTYLVRVSKVSDGISINGSSQMDAGLDRDFIEINLGHQYLNSSQDLSLYLDVLNAILSRRFQLAGRNDFTNLQEILGSGVNPFNLGPEIHRLATARKLRMLRYHGYQIFTLLFSSDISTILEVLRMLYEANQNTGFPISVNIQQQVIRNYCRKRMFLLRDVKSQFIPSLYNICYYFGALSKYMLIKKEKEFQGIEIEVDDESDSDINAISELLISGIFNDAGIGSSFHGKIARRLIFRRMFTPIFPTSLVNRNSFIMDSKSFNTFLNDPKKYTHNFILKLGDDPDQIRGL